MGEPALPRPPAPSLGIPRGLDKSKALLTARFANTVAEQTQINSSQQTLITQDTRVWKRAEESFISGAASQGRWQARALTGGLCQQEGPREFYRRSSGRYKRAGRVDGHGCGAVSVQPLTLGGEGDCGVWSSRHSIAVRDFWLCG